MPARSRPTRSYAIIGTGALGGYYGARLARAGFDVRFLFHGDYATAQAQGLRVESEEAGDLSIPVDALQAFGSAADLPPADVALVCLKTTANAALPNLLPHAVKPDGLVVVLQNGLGVESVAGGIVGHDRVLGGLCFLCSNKVGPAHIHHLCYGKIKLGEHTADQSAGGITDRLQAVADDLASTGVPVEPVADLRLARWQKLAWNIPFNGLSVVLDALTDELMRDQDARALVDRLIRDVQASAAAEGRVIDEPFITNMLADTEKMTPYRTSMKLDYDAGRPMEVDAIVGAPYRAAAAAGHNPPYLQWLYHQLSYLDRSHRPGS